MASLSALVCFEKQRLMDAYSQAVTDHNRLQSAHLAALLNGEEQTFHEELALAEVHKENAKFAILAHRREHGC